MAGERGRAGWEARARITVYDDNGVQLYSPKYIGLGEWSIKPKAPGLDSSNTEGKPGRSGAAVAPGFQARTKNMKGADVRFVVRTFDDSADPFSSNPAGAGYSIREGAYAKIEIWPNRNDVPDTSKCHSCEFQVTEIEYAGQVGGLQPCTVVGESDGNYNFA